MIVNYLELGFVFCLSGSLGVYIQQNDIGLYSLDTFIHIMYILSDFQSIFVDSDVLYIIDLLTFQLIAFHENFFRFSVYFFVFV